MSPSASASPPSTWQQVAISKKDRTNNAIPSSWLLPTSSPYLSKDSYPNATTIPPELLTASEQEITTAPTTTLLQNLREGTWSSVQVTEAFCHRAAIAHQLTNCLTEIFFPQALSRAKELDAYLQTHHKPIGPLHGLPMSLKDTFRVAGVETGMGYVGWLGKTETKGSQSAVVNALEKAGAVFYVKTNVPTGLMYGETDNNIMGYTWNANNRNFSSGGSSGGEGALIAMNGSALGLGTDIAGSIRIPAAANGIHGFRPSHGRLPTVGVANSMDGQYIVPSVIGPLGRSVNDLTLLVKTIVDSEPWDVDSTVWKQPWRAEAQAEVEKEASEKQLSFAVLMHDGSVTPHPPVTRALKLAVEKLREQSHEVIEWSPPSHADGVGILVRTITADGGADIHSSLSKSGESVPSHVSLYYGEKLNDNPQISITDYWKLNLERQNYQTRYHNYWLSTASKTKTGKPVDAVLMPIIPSASFEKGKSYYFGYAGIVNTLDYNSVVLPVTNVDKTVDRKVEGYTPTNEFDRLVYESYEPEIFDKMPVSIQLLGRKLDEERTLALAEVVDRAIGRK